MEYTVNTDRNIDDLITEVNTLLKQGWKCIGGISILNHDNYKIYYQDMIK